MLCQRCTCNTATHWTGFCDTCGNEEVDPPFVHVLPKTHAQMRYAKLQSKVGIQLRAWCRRNKICTQCQEAKALYPFSRCEECINYNEAKQKAMAK